LPGRQLRQVGARLAGSACQVVVISQPYAYQVFERLPARYPRTLFVNRTHGWEARLYEAQRNFGWDGQASRRLVARVSAALTRRACRRTARAAHGMVTGSQRCGAWIRQAYHLPPERVAAIPYGLDPHVGPDPGGAASMAVRPRAPGPLRLLYVGNYLPLKGSTVLESILPPLGGRFPGARLTLVVDPGARDRVASRYQPSWGENLAVQAWLPRHQLARVYAEHDVLLYPSLFEGFGKVWLEAMAQGLCVVGFAEGGLPDVARHGEDALYCPTGDLDGLTTLLERALSSPEQARAIGGRAALTARQFTWDRNAAALVAFCQGLGGRT
ncbi:MAG TPA: glycosyltransferase family 4 protein, partial [Gemmatimonadales bacterium]|nr:glycosyltransferase family 4 protein [Gemmatimonadales bacterium]